jgi:hypothetical protein
MINGPEDFGAAFAHVQGTARGEIMLADWRREKIEKSGGPMSSGSLIGFEQFPATHPLEHAPDQLFSFFRGFFCLSAGI